MDDRTAAALKSLYTEFRTQKQAIDQLMALQKASADAPKWVEQIPGRRVPYLAAIDLTIAASSTSKVEGTHTVSEDGPFVCTGVALFYQKTSGNYCNIWGYASAADARIPPTQAGQGFQTIFDQPHIISGDVSITDRGSDRKWESKDIASALYSPQAGGAYILPISCMFSRNSVIEIGFTPGVSMPVAGKVQAIFLGYKIVQGSVYQP
jgi:hypothetical protein